MAKYPGPFLLDRLRVDFERANLSSRHEALLRQSWDVVVLLSEDGTIIEVNDRVFEYYGRTPGATRPTGYRIAVRLLQ